MDDTYRNAARGGGEAEIPSDTVEDIFNDFISRRSALLKALTTDSDSLYSQCKPESRNMSVYGYSNGTWKASVPLDNPPPDIPEPVIGINFARDGMQRQDWLAFIAAHSDSWLLSVAYYFSGTAGLGRDERSRLFGLINNITTLFEVLTGKK